MAEHGTVEYAAATGNDAGAHERTYRGFLSFVKFGTVAVIVIVTLMAIFLL